VALADNLPETKSVEHITIISARERHVAALARRRCCGRCRRRRHSSSTSRPAISRGDDGGARRAFICRTLNPYGFPAKDRSGRLDMIEEPHLGKLMDKISGPATPAAERLSFGEPALSAAAHPNT
jgi:hypothetical protein